MSRDFRWRSVEQLFARALEQPAEGREAFVSAACGPNLALRDEVLSLLRAHDEAGEFLEVQPLPDSPVVLRPPLLTPGTKLGAFEIEAHLGTGGMGTVYRARDLRLDRSVALKVLTPGPALPERSANGSNAKRAPFRGSPTRTSAPCTTSGTRTHHPATELDWTFSSWSCFAARHWPSCWRMVPCLFRQPSATGRKSRTRSPVRTPRASSIAI